MKRREFIKSAATGLLATNTLNGVSFPAPQQLSIVIRGAKSFYQGQWQTPDVGIDSLGRLKFGDAGTLTSGNIVQSQGKHLFPGFIDILADNAASPERTYKIFEKYKVSDGVTTALQMHGGTAACAAYYNKFSALPHRINFGVSTAVMRVRYATASLRERILKVERCLDEGALGVSHSLEYQPTPFEEVLEYCRLAKKYGRTFFLHLRYSSERQELEGVDEAIRLARESGCRLHIDHLHSTGGTFRMAEALEKIRNANREGIVVTCCVYPYSYWATYLNSMRFDAGWQERYHLTYNDLRLVGTGERLTAQSFEKYRQMKKLAAVPEGTLPLTSTVYLALKEDFCMIGSDGGIEYEPRANSHPRGAGCFATSVRHMAELGFPPEKIQEKLVTLPRSLVLPAMRDRGVLSDGAMADLVVLEMGKVDGQATVENPNQFSRGIELVVVNGKVAYRNGTLGDSAGKAIRHDS